jgi:hypothetical protein
VTVASCDVVTFQRRYLGAGVIIGVALALGACGLVAPLDGLTGGASEDAGNDAFAGDDSAGGAVDTAVVPMMDATPSDAPDMLVDGGEAGGPAPCADGGIRCGGGCVDPTDPSNCNGCGNACTSGICGTTITAALMTAPSLWSFNGSAFFNSFAPSAELTREAVNDQAGTFVYSNPVNVDSVSVAFEFRIGLNGGTRSDGTGFMLEQTGSTAVGQAGGGLGMAGLAGYGVELDIYDNAECGDTSNDHVGADSLTLCDAMEGTPTSLQEQDVSSMLDLADTHWHSALVTIASSLVTVAIDGTTVINHAALAGLQAGAPYYIGFAGGTGGLVTADGGSGGYRQEVRDIVVTFPTPQCL